jgi:hypothetical protein
MDQPAWLIRGGRDCPQQKYKRESDLLRDRLAQRAQHDAEKFQDEERGLKKSLIQLGTKFVLPSEILRLLYKFSKPSHQFPPGINPKISYELYTAITQNFVESCLMHSQHPRDNMVDFMKFMSCKEHDDDEKIGLNANIQRGYDPRCWDQLGPPKELRKKEVDCFWIEREEDIFEDIFPTRWPILYVDHYELIEEHQPKLRCFTEFINELKIASETGLSIKKKNGLRLPQVKLAIADCEFLRNITSTSGRESSSSRVGYTKKTFLDIFSILYNFYKVCHPMTPRGDNVALMDHRQKKIFLKPWLSFFEIVGSDEVMGFAPYERLKSKFDMYKTE